MDKLKLSCGCGMEISVTEDSPILKQIFPFYPWVQQGFYCVKCGYAVYVEKKKIEQEQEIEHGRS